MSDRVDYIALTSVAMATSQSPSRSRFAMRSPREALQPVAAPAPPPRRRRRSGFLGRISGILSLLVFATAILGSVAIYVTTEVNSAGPLAADKVVLIPKSSSSSDIVELLAREGVIDHPTLTSAWIVLKQPRLRAGEFLFRKEASIADTVKVLETAKPITYKVTLPEGLTSEQIVDRLLENDVLNGQIREVPREGTLMPDTYSFERGYSREHLLRDMRASQERLVKDIWSRRAPDVPVKSPQELVTLASIVEKETGKPDERARVASVFVNRLNRDMRLQTDPTVIYGIVGGRGSLGRGLTRAELDTPTPYNTYTIKGLPPGPIANPGKAALEAVANPLKTNELYFVADGSGGHAFAETRAQHERNVARWRQYENQAAQQPQPVQPQSLQPQSLQPQPSQQPPQTGSVAPVPPLVAPAPTIPTPTIPNQRGALPGPQTPVGTAPSSSSPPQLPPTPAPGTRSQLPLRNAPRLVANPLPLPGPSFFVTPLPIVQIAGVTDGPDGPLDGSGTLASENFEDGDAVGGPVESYPVPASRRTGGHTVTAGLQPSDAYRGGQTASAFQSVPGSEVQTRSRAFDAVEGTAKDPLRNTSFDLNSPKTVPALR